MKTNILIGEEIIKPRRSYLYTESIFIPVFIHTNEYEDDQKLFAEDCNIIVKTLNCSIFKFPKDFKFNININ